MLEFRSGLRLQVGCIHISGLTSARQSYGCQMKVIGILGAQGVSYGSKHSSMMGLGNRPHKI